MGGFVFNAFLADAIAADLIKPSSFRDQAKIDVGKHGLVFRRSFSTKDIQLFARNNLLMSLGAAAIATDTAMDAVFTKDNKPHDTSDVGAARVFMFSDTMCFCT